MNVGKAIANGLDEQTAFESVTINPARAIGVDNITGSIAENKFADLLITDADFKEIKAVFVKGKRIV